MHSTINITDMPGTDVSPVMIAYYDILNTCLWLHQYNHIGGSTRIIGLKNNHHTTHLTFLVLVSNFSVHAK